MTLIGATLPSPLRTELHQPLTSSGHEEHVIVNVMNRGFAGIWLVVGLVVLVGGGIAYWAFTQKSNAPAEENTNATQTSSPTPPTGTANWKTYRSEVWGIEFKYPSTFVLNTTPHEFWKNFSPYRSGDNFFELIDVQRGCYVGPAKAVGLGYAPSKESSIRTSDGSTIEVKYWTSSDGAVLFGIINHIIPNSDLSLEFTVTSLSGDLIESNYKNASASHSVSEGCVKDFEAILATLTFTK